MTWYEQWFDRDEYDLVYGERDAAEHPGVVDLVLAIARPAEGARILDVGCGRGRHALGFARRGYRVTGLDLSARAIRQARERARDAALGVRFVQGDMREVVEPGGFDLVVNLFTAFGYFEDPADHQRAVGAMAASLAPGGVLVQDFLHAAHVRRHLPSDDERRIGDTVLRQRRWVEENRVKKEILFERGDASHAFVESVALLEPEAFERMYADAGLAMFDRRGSYGGEPFGDHSPRLILFARRETAP